MSVLNAARKAVPAVDYALGAAGIAAAGAIVVAFLGNGRGAVVVLGGMLVAMVLLFVFARLLATRNAATMQAGLVLMWMVVAFFGLFLAFTATAIAIQWPPAWAQILGIDTPNPHKKAMEKLLEVPSDVSALFKSNPKPLVELVRLQPRLAIGAVFAEREAAISGGGAYYSFARRTHEYGFGSDIELEPGVFVTGFAGADYGFFMRIGQGTANNLATMGRDSPPLDLKPSRLDAWKYMWAYRPPTEIKKIREEQKKAQGFAVGSATLSARAPVNKGEIYLLRSILIRDSDLLVVFLVVDILGDGSVVLAWRTLEAFDTPIQTDAEN